MFALEVELYFKKAKYQMEEKYQCITLILLNYFGFVTPVEPAHFQRKFFCCCCIFSLITLKGIAWTSSQTRFRSWLYAIRHQAINRTNNAWYLCHHLVSKGDNHPTPSLYSAQVIFDTRTPTTSPSVACRTPWAQKCMIWFKTDAFLATTRIW